MREDVQEASPALLVNPRVSDKQVVAQPSYTNASFANRTGVSKLSWVPPEVPHVGLKQVTCFEWDFYHPF